jgi:hypothetical protein
MVAAQRELFAAERSIAARTVYDGVGEGGDHTLAIDRRSEDIVFAELERLNEEAAVALMAPRWPLRPSLLTWSLNAGGWPCWSRWNAPRPVVTEQRRRI